MNDESKDIRDELAAFLDGELDEEARSRLGTRLKSDAALRAELEALRAVDAHYRNLPEVRAPEDFEARLKTRLHPPEKVDFGARRRPRRQRLWPMLAAAAVLLLMGGLFVPWLVRTETPPIQIARETPAAPEAAEPLQRFDLDFLAEKADDPVPEPVAEQDRKHAPRDEPPGRAALPDEVHPQLEALGYLAPGEAPPAEEKPTTRSEQLEREREYSVRMYAAPPSPPAADPSPVDEPAPPKREPADLFMAPMDAPPVAAEPPPHRKRTINDTVFRLTEGVWVQRGYAGGAFHEVARDSEAFTELLQAHPRLRHLFDLGPRVIFKLNGTWYGLGEGFPEDLDALAHPAP